MRLVQANHSCDECGHNIEWQAFVNKDVLESNEKEIAGATVLKYELEITTPCPGCNSMNVLKKDLRVN